MMAAYARKLAWRILSFDIRTIEGEGGLVARGRGGVWVAVALQVCPWCLDLHFKRKKRKKVQVQVPGMKEKGPFKN